LNIRLAHPDELRNLGAMVRELYPDDPFSESQFMKAAEKGVSWIAEDKDKWAAHLVSELAKGAPYIWSVATYPAYRGKGLATTLIQEFEKHYKTAGYVKAWLHVKVKNPAQKLYFDLGYRVSSFEPNIYGAHEHGLIMRKSL
jgi:ribosomal protein S18 acetylase RimI-like enzyme